MSYTITQTSGATLATIADGTTDTNTTSLALIGKNYAGYGVFLNENFVALLENFASGIAPTNPLAGQLWYNTSSKTVNFRTVDSAWKTIASISGSDQEPDALNSVAGDFWWDTTASQLKVYDGSAWVVIGPTYTAAAGTSGAIVETILDTALNNRIVVKFYISNTVIAILTRESFTPQLAIAGFTSFKPGFNLISSATLTNAQYSGDAENALKLQGLTASQFLRRDQNTDTPFRLQVDSLAIGSSGEITKTANTEVAVRGLALNADLNLYVNSGGTTRRGLGILGSNVAAFLRSTHIDGTLRVSNAAIFSETLSVSGVTTLQNTVNVSARIQPTVAGTYEIGSSSLQFSNVWATTFRGTSVQAQYADLAERFEADRSYPTGTVVALGGEKEITAEENELSEDVFGVISTAAGFLMNGGAGQDSTHPPIAMTGRVPVRVVGRVRKGDRLVSAGAGLARAASRNEITAFNVIGRALESKDTLGEGMVEATVKLNS